MALSDYLSHLQPLAQVLSQVPLERLIRLAKLPSTEAMTQTTAETEPEGDEYPEADEYKRDYKETTQEGIKQRLQAAKAVSHLSTEDTIRYQNRQIGKELLAMEHHLAQRMRIQGVPCDCGATKHLLFLEGLCQETIPMTGNPSDYEAIISWVSESEPKCTEEAAKSGKYDEEYPVMASQARDLRKRVLGTVEILAMVEEGQEMSLEEAKREAAEVAQKEVERKWHSTEQK